MVGGYRPTEQDESWNMDRIPEIMDGKNVADFVDDDIDAKLALLEKEEDQLQVRIGCFCFVLFFVNVWVALCFFFVLP